MSGKIVGMVFDFYPARGNELLLAVKLADNAHDDGTHIFPAVATLADATRQSERSVQYQIQRMLASGWLELVREARGGGRGGGPGRAREYRINPLWVKAHDMRIPEAERPTWTPKAQNPAREMGAKTAPISQGKGVQPRAEMGATAIAEMGATATAPEPSLTPIETTPLTPHGGRAPENVPRESTRDGFEALASAYPRRTRLRLARQAFDELAPGAQQLGEILAGVAAWKVSEEWQRANGRYVPKLADFLRDKRWLDAPGVRIAAPAPTPPRRPPLTPEQLAENRRRADEAVARIKGRAATC
jgi:hypothetical protein